MLKMCLCHNIKGNTSCLPQLVPNELILCSLLILVFDGVMSRSSRAAFISTTPRRRQPEKNKLQKGKSSSSALHTLKEVVVVARAHAHITLCSETSSLIDAVSEFGERDGGSGRREIRRERGKQIKKRERAQEASIKRRNQIVSLVFHLFSLFSASASFSIPHLFFLSHTNVIDGSPWRGVGQVS